MTNAHGHDGNDEHADEYDDTHADQSDDLEDEETNAGVTPAPEIAPDRMD
jgi:hypothetical protein